MGKPKEPIVGLDLSVARTAGEAYDAVARAFSERRLTLGEARVAIELVKLRSGVVVAEEFRKRLELAEAAAREATRRAALLGPASAAVIEATAVPFSSQERRG